jgi:hypothetical protein
VLPDGRHAAIALSSTDYAPLLESPPTRGAEHLLDLDGLRQVIKLLDRLAQPERAIATPGDRIGARPSQPR